MSKRTHILRDHIDLDGERYVLLDATPGQVLRWLHKHHRAEAFAAIRRAVAVARAAEDYREGHYDPELDRMFSWIYDHDQEPIAIARGIRMAIRAAIGSEKS